MPTREEYETKIQALEWPDLLALWDGIKVRDTPEWGAGRAFEYLVLRAFDLNGAVVRWPYGVSLYGQREIVEEIDGSVRVGALYSLIESKDENDDIAIAPIAKLRNQLLRRPAGTFGMVFSSHGFTDPAIQLAQFALPQSILLWTGDEVELRFKPAKHLRALRDEISNVRGQRHGRFQRHDRSDLMRVYLLVEGNSAAEFLRRLLPAEIEPEITIVTAGGRSNITSKARSLMVAKRRPIALVADTKVTEKGAVEQRMRTLEELLGSATAGVPYKAIFAVPEIESWFFAVPDALERLSGKKLSPDQRELAEVRPKEILTKLFKDEGSLFVEQLASKLTEPEIQTLRETQPRKDLIDFITEHVNKKTEPQPA